MGWLPWGSSDDKSAPKKTKDGAFEAPNKTNRTKCYEARDAFFECLDRNQILDSINSRAGQVATQQVCGPEDQVFEKSCAHSWVEYFKKQRVVNYQKEQMVKKIEAEGGNIQPPHLSTRS
ncbi:cytochrome oxidase c subunit VIb-domain-containing protein [Clohesyomyces aquaticus]|uniref:Cytochrome oxidase c subunit VIb-domain-containing protein n=1 Tax=Clohesyomyces aquaticus TaxID=1231657 RepID=A0A1Y1ZZU5_9PLEO|nr:cytochrome oxidase c subunit VIb-domain-containing protein [Clohesyomyces aquaticus]